MTFSYREEFLLTFWFLNLFGLSDNLTLDVGVGVFGNENIKKKVMVFKTGHLDDFVLYSHGT